MLEEKLQHPNAHGKVTSLQTDVSDVLNGSQKDVFVCSRIASVQCGVSLAAEMLGMVKAANSTLIRSSALDWSWILLTDRTHARPNSGKAQSLWVGTAW